MLPEEIKDAYKSEELSIREEKTDFLPKIIIRRKKNGAEVTMDYKAYLNAYDPHTEEWRQREIIALDEKKNCVRIIDVMTGTGSKGYKSVAFGTTVLGPSGIMPTTFIVEDDNGFHIIDEKHEESTENYASITPVTSINNEYEMDFLAMRRKSGDTKLEYRDCIGRILPTMDASGRYLYEVLYKGKPIEIDKIDQSWFNDPEFTKVIYTTIYQRCEKQRAEINSQDIPERKKEKQRQKLVEKFTYAMQRIEQIRELGTTFSSALLKAQEI